MKLRIFVLYVLVWSGLCAVDYPKLEWDGAVNGAFGGESASFEILSSPLKEGDPGTVVVTFRAMAQGGGSWVSSPNYPGWSMNVRVGATERVASYGVIGPQPAPAMALVTEEYPVGHALGVSLRHGEDVLASHTYILGELAQKRVKISVRNTKSYPVRYELIQDGKVIGGFTLGPGQALIAEYVASGLGDVSLVAYVDNLMRDGAGVWTVVEGAVVEQTVDKHVPTLPPVPTPPVPSPEPDTPNELPNAPLTPGSGGQNGKPIWTTPVPNTDPAKQVDLLTNAVYREGVGKVTDAVNAQKSAGGAKVDLKPVTDRLDTVNANLAKLETREQRDAKVSEAEAAGLAEAQTFGSKYQAALDDSLARARTAAETAANTGVLGGGRTLANGAHMVVGTSGASGRSIRIEGLDLTMDINPFTSAEVADVAGGAGVMASWARWVRDITGWFICVGFLVYVALEVKKSCHELAHMRQEQLSPTTRIALQTSVAGNSIGVVAAGVMWAAGVVIISTLILSAPVIIVAAFSASAGGDAVVTAGLQHAANALNPTGVVGEAVGYVDRFLPLALIVTTAANALLVQVTALTQWVVFSVGMRVIPL